MRSAGRVAAVLIMCGLTLSIDALFAYCSSLVEVDFYDSDEFFYCGRHGAWWRPPRFVGAAVALITLLVGAGDALVDARRPLATLAALGLDQRALTRVLARQLQATAVPAIALGALRRLAVALRADRRSPSRASWSTRSTRSKRVRSPPSSPRRWSSSPRRWPRALLRPLTRAATAPENLRAP